MKTNFTETQLKQPDIARADSILRKCVHCGICTATCPTYIIAGDERDSPRGRIWMIRDMLENPDADAATTSHHLDRCLTCLSCTSSCPSGVDYMHLVDIGRRQAARRHQRGFADKIIRRFLVGVLPRAGRAYAALTLGWLLRPLRHILPNPLASMLEAAPAKRPRLDPVGSRDQIFTAEKIPARARVILLAGCAQRAVNPEINAATIRLLNRIGVEVVVRRKAYCCGALAHHTGDEPAAEKAMASAINAWADEKKNAKIDAIIINTSGCGTMVKDYGDYFAGHKPGHNKSHNPGHNKGLAEDAAAVSGMTMDITEFLADFDLGNVDIGTGDTSDLTVAYHAACSLQHGQKILSAPKDLLRRAGFTVKDIADAHLCCGAAGTYNVLQPGFAEELKQRKLKSINDAGGDIVAAGNIGCINQLAESRAPVLHTVQLLDWATGGPKPPEISQG